MACTGPSHPLPSDVEQATDAKIKAQIDRAMAFLSSTFGVAQEGMPTWKRTLAAYFAAMVIAGGAGYGIGCLAGYAMIGCFALTGSLFLMYLIMVLAILLSAYAGMKIGQYVGNYVLSGQIDRDVVRAKNWVTGFFKSKPTAPVAA